MKSMLEGFMRQFRQKLRASSSILRVHNALTASKALNVNSIIQTYHFGLPLKNSQNTYCDAVCAANSSYNSDHSGHHQFPVMSDIIIKNGMISGDGRFDEGHHDKYSPIVCWVIWIGFAMIGWSAISFAVGYLL